MKSSRATLGSCPVRVEATLDGSPGQWTVTLGLTAFPPAEKKIPNHLFFLIDISASMKRSNRLDLVKTAMFKLLDEMPRHHTFSLIVFNEQATCLTEQATFQTKEQAKILLNKTEAKGETNFTAAFTCVRQLLSKHKHKHPAIIFLTDGEDTKSNPHLTPVEQARALNNMVNLPKKSPVPITCIGINVHEAAYALLAALQTNTPFTQPYLIDDQTAKTSNTDYTRAMTHAYKQVTTYRSTQPLTLTAHIRGKNRDVCHYTTQLSQLTYDGHTASQFTYPFTSQSEAAALSFQVEFATDRHRLLGHGHFKHTHTPALTQLKWKDNRLSSWLKSISSLMIALLLFGGGSAFYFFSPLAFPITLTLCSLAGLVGLTLFVYGCVSTLRKTLFLPTIPTATTRLSSHAILPTPAMRRLSLASSATENPIPPFTVPRSNQVAKSFSHR